MGLTEPAHHEEQGAPRQHDQVVRYHAVRTAVLVQLAISSTTDGCHVEGAYTTSRVHHPRHPGPSEIEELEVTRCEPRIPKPDPVQQQEQERGYEVALEGTSLGTSSRHDGAGGTGTCPLEIPHVPVVHTV